MKRHKNGTMLMETLEESVGAMLAAVAERSYTIWVAPFGRPECLDIQQYLQKIGVPPALTKLLPLRVEYPDGGIAMVGGLIVPAEFMTDEEFATLLTGLGLKPRDPRNVGSRFFFITADQYQGAAIILHYHKAGIACPGVDLTVIGRPPVDPQAN